MRAMPSGPRPRISALRLALALLLLAPLLFTGACRIQADKNAGDGSGDHVKISTPLGGLNVRSKDVDAATLGLPEYPSAHQLTKEENNDSDGSVDLHMGFGPWQMRIKVVSYGTPDSRDKVMAFYRAALGKYGDVIECADNKPVGSPSVTQEGLDCDRHHGSGEANGSEGGGVHVNENDVELKAGSKLRQHIVGFKKPAGGETRFALISLELPNTRSHEQTN